VNTDNQQEIGLVARLSWLAGIMDGEGCIALMVFPQRKRGGFRLQARATIGNTDEGIVERIITTMQEIGVGFHVQQQVSKRYGCETGRMIKLIHVSTTTNLQRFLTIMLPRLASTEKVERGKILLRLIELRMERSRTEGKRNNTCYTQADVDLILEFLRLTKSKTVDRLAEFLNEHTREVREARAHAKRSNRSRHDVLWSHARV